MVAFPPKYRTFIKSSNGIRAKSIPSPKGFSLVTEHSYAKLVIFYENTYKEPLFCNWRKIERDFTQVLEYYYPFSGRLICTGNGHYDIADFDKGALFEVADSADNFSDYKKGNFSYTSVPYEKLTPLESYVSRDCPIVGIKITILKDGSFVMGYSWHHKVADGLCLIEFVKLFCRISKGENISDSEVIFYTDDDRKPLTPTFNEDASSIFPTVPFKKRSLPTVPFNGPSQRLVYCLSKQNEIQLMKDVLQEAGQPNARISRFNVYLSLIRKALTRARLLDGNNIGDIICTVANHRNCEDKNMMKYLGNYAMQVPFFNTVEEVMNKSVYDLALELRRKTKVITVPYMESLEYYLNNHGNVKNILKPLCRTRYGAVAATDWTKFKETFDFGCGPSARFRNPLDLSPMPLLSISVSPEEELEAVIQLDPASMERLLKDSEFMKYISAVY